jgi:regulatory protein YycH of two-component signal transduction system YycFG
LWTYQSEYHKPENTKYVESAIVLDGKRTLAEVVHPATAIYQKKNGEIVGVPSGSDLKDMFQMVTKAEFHGTQIFGKNGAPQQKVGKPRTNGISMVFPVSIPLSLFGKMLQGDSGAQTEKTAVFAEADSSISFDRIVFYHLGEENTTNMEASFKNGEKQVATAKVNNLSFTDLEKFYKDAEEYAPEKLNGKTVYLPSNPVKVEKILYYYKWIGDAQFKNVLFNNNPYVTQRQGYYTSYSQLLKINNHIINYINTEPGSEKTNQPDKSSAGSSSVIQDSFSYINGQSGWTDSYMLFDYTPIKSSRRSVTFRMMIGYDDRKSYPVFSDVSGAYPYNDAGTIRLSWENGGVYEYGRTEMDVGDLPDGKKPVLLPSGKTVLNKLKTSKNVHMDLVKDLCIGYQMEYPTKPKEEVVRFTPMWYVLYDGSWEPAEQLTKPKKQAQGGAEQ